MVHRTDYLIRKALNMEQLEIEEALFLYNNCSSGELIFVADILREIHNPGKRAGWIIDRNINITNVCFSQCSFCNFCKKKGDAEAYVTSIEEYKTKIDELFSKGGDQILLQGGMNPALGLDFYTDLFGELKSIYPRLKLHALGPPEIVYLAGKEKKSYEFILIKLIEAGLDSLPGAGAEILSDRVRRIISPAKATTREWLDVMRVAHRLNLPTSATMMLGHVETVRERIEHLILLREVQNEKEPGSYGFISFIPWPFMDKGTKLKDVMGISGNYNPSEYLRLISVARIILNNIPNIQVSVLTTGPETGIVALNAGANDVGSIMIEENVVSSAGSSYRFDTGGLQQIIKDAGFVPVRRDQKYQPVQ